LRCAKHPDVETSVSCGRCETPLCVKCMAHTDVGVRCHNCAPARPMLAGANRLRNIIIIVGLIFVAVLLLGGVGSLSSGGASDPGGASDYQQLIEDEFAEYQADVTVSQLVDPWSPDLPADAPSAGRRYVALEVTLANPDDSEFPRYVEGAMFKLTDSADFAYSPIDSLIEPELTESLELAPGQKTQGWIMFEIDDENAIQSVYYWTDEVALPD
jgi:uncharacterized protein DUF4352